MEEQHTGDFPACGCGADAFSRVLTTISDAVISTDKDFLITSWNRAAEKMYGWTAKEALGRNIDGLLHTEFLSMPPEEAFRRLRGYGTVAVEVVHTTRSGARLSIQSSVALLRDASGAVTGSLGINRNITERKQAEEALQRLADEMTGQARRFEAVLSSVQDYLYVFDREARFVFANKMLLDLWGLTAEQALGKTMGQLGYPAEVEAQLLRDHRHVIETGGVARSETHYTSPAGIGAHYENILSPVFDADGQVAFIAGASRDITERKLLEEALKESEARFRGIFENAVTGIAIADLEGRFKQCNSAFAALIGYTEEELRGTPFSSLIHPEDREANMAEVRRLQAGEVLHFELENRYVRKDGAPVWVHKFVTLLRDETGKPMYAVVTVIDITDRKLLEEELKHQAHHDALTGLPNRRLFTDMLGLELAKARRSGSGGAVLFLDLDRFKHINDTLGHDIGDRLLCCLAERLRTGVRGSDIIARTGGDEFTVLLTGLCQARDIAPLAHKLVALFREPCRVGEHALYVTASVGISVFPHDADSIEALFKNADIAMYHAKGLGGNAYQFYDAALNIRTKARMRMESWLRQSLVRGELEVYYQPQIDLAAQRVVCAEALVRWRHPERGLLAPQHFIPLAEESGFITVIDEWVLRTACGQMKAWQEAGLPPLCVTVNLSAKQFQKADFVERVAQVLQETGLDPARLDLEITESTAMKSLEHTVPTMSRLAELGVGFAIDDFGTGYSSLSYLKKLPIQKLKIDRSFVRDLATDPDDRTIVQAVTAMARNMKLRVIAEGVETEEQAAILEAVGCREMQGFLFGKPLPAEEFKGLFA